MAHPVADVVIAVKPGDIAPFVFLDAAQILAHLDDSNFASTSTYSKSSTQCNNYAIFSSKNR